MSYHICLPLLYIFPLIFCLAILLVIIHLPVNIVSLHYYASLVIMSPHYYAPVHFLLLCLPYISCYYVPVHLLLLCPPVIIHLPAVISPLLCLLINIYIFLLIYVSPFYYNCKHLIPNIIFLLIIFLHHYTFFSCLVISISITNLFYFVSQN